MTSVEREEREDWVQVEVYREEGMEREGERAKKDRERERNELRKEGKIENVSIEH